MLYSAKNNKDNPHSKGRWELQYSNELELYVKSKFPRT